MEKAQKEFNQEQKDREDMFKSMFDNLNASVDAFNQKLKSFNLTVDEMKTEDVRSDSDIIAEIITPKGKSI